MVPIEMPCVCPGCGDTYELNDLVVRSGSDDLTCVGCRDEWLAENGPPTEDELIGLLHRAAAALREVGKKAIVVKSTLNKPYDDAPGETPWTRFMEEPVRVAYNLGCEIGDRLRRADV